MSGRDAGGESAIRCGHPIYYWQRASAVGFRLLAATVQQGPPLAVVQTDTVLAGQYSPYNTDIHPQGDRLISTVPAGTAEGAETESRERHLIVVNWFEELKERMGGN